MELALPYNYTLFRPSKSNSISLSLSLEAEGRKGGWGKVR